VAERLNTDQTTISRWLRKFDIDTTPERTKKLREGDWLKEQYWESGKSTTEIADDLGCSDHAVNSWMEKHDIKRRTRGPQRFPHASFSMHNGY